MTTTASIASKEDQHKYDRQLRLWGASGQRRLMSAHVCVLGSGAAASETLKNLVLPGIGEFTIVDDAVVSEEDYETNFFVERRAAASSPRAEMVRDLLAEMNPDVKGHSYVHDVRHLIREDPKWFAKFSLVIATQLEETSLVTLGEVCGALNLPLVVVRTYGLMAHVRLYLREHCVVESKPSPEPQPDLRIADPFPELKALASSLDLESLSYHEYKHVPYVLILVKLMEEWRRRHNGASPATSAEKEEFRRGIKALSKKEWGEEENLTEAFANAYLAYVPRRIPPELEEWMRDEKTERCPATFWVMMRALRIFVENHSLGRLPVCSTLPDMTATTEMYIALQRCYKERATQDVRSFSAIVEQVVREKAGAPMPTLEECQVFCASALGIAVLRYRSLKEEFERPRPDYLREYVFNDPELEGDSQFPLYWYFLWRGCDAFFTASKGRSMYPAQDPALDYDAEALEAAAREVLSTTHAIMTRDYHGVGNVKPSSVTIEMAREMVRYGASREVHNICALAGGVAAQEVVKLLTGQYIPLQNTWFFNGISGIGGVYEL